MITFLWVLLHRLNVLMYRTCWGECLALLWAQAMIALIICNQTAINLFSGSLLSNFFAMLIFQEKGHIRVFIIVFFFNFSSMFRGHYRCKLNCPRCDSMRVSNGNGSCLISRWDYVSTEERLMCPLDSTYGGRKVDRRPTGFEEYMQNGLGEHASHPSTHAPVLGGGIPVTWYQAEMGTGRDWEAVASRLGEKKPLVHKRQDKSGHQSFLKRANGGIG